MKQTTYFQAKGNSFYITKKHIAIIIFIWWMFVNFYTYVIAPFTFFIYKSLSQIGDQPILKQNLPLLKQQFQQKKQKQIQQNKNLKNKQQKTNSKNQNGDEKIRQKQNFKSQNRQQKKEQSSGQQIRMRFKIKGKKGQMQKMKNQMTEQALRIAMQTYYEEKNNIKNYQEEL